MKFENTKKRRGKKDSYLARRVGGLGPVDGDEPVSRRRTAIVALVTKVSVLKEMHLKERALLARAYRKDENKTKTGTTSRI